MSMSQPKRILVVDDEPDVTELIAYRLRKVSGGPCMGIDLFFCDWAKRATEQAVAFLISQNSTPTFDFRDTATIVATRQAGRHLRR